MKFKTANGMIAYHEGIPCPEDPGMTDSEWLLWQKAINDPGPFDCVVGWRVKTRNGDVVKSYLDYNQAIDNCSQGCTVEQVNKRDLIEDVLPLCPDCEGEGEIKSVGCGRCGGSGDFYPVFNH